MNVRLSGGVQTTTPAGSDVEALHARIRDLEAALGQRDPSIGVALRLPEALTKVMGLLLALPNVTPDMVCQRLQIATDTKVAMHRLRKAMQVHGVTIHSKRYIGYWIEDADKERIRALVASELQAKGGAHLSVAVDNVSAPSPA